MNISSILSKFHWNIVQILSRYYQIPSKYPDKTQILSKAVAIHCPNIVKIFSKEYYPIFIKLLSKYCLNIYLSIYHPDVVKKITKTLPKYCPKSIQILSEYFPNIVQILSKYYPKQCLYIVHILYKYYPNIVQMLSKYYQNIAQILSK